MSKLFFFLYIFFLPLVVFSTGLELSASESNLRVPLLSSDVLEQGDSKEMEGFASQTNIMIPFHLRDGSVQDGFREDDVAQGYNVRAPLLLGDDSQMVLKWAEENILNDMRKLDGCKKHLWILELFNGAGRGVLFFKLGYNLGEHLFSKAGTGGSAFLSSIVGIGSFIPSAVLGTKASQRIFKRIFSKKLDSEKNVEFEESLAVRAGEYAVKIPIVIAGLISAPPMTYLTYDELHKSISWAWILPGIPTYYTRTLIDFDAITTLCNKVYYEIKDPLDRNHAKSHDDRRSVISNLKTTLVDARTFVRSLSYEQAKRVSNELDSATRELSTDLADSVTLKKLRILFNPDLYLDERVEINEDSWKKKAAGYLGGLVGGYGMWVYYPVAVDSYKPVLSLFGSEDNHPLQTGFAITSTATACALTALATWSSTHKFYDSVAGAVSSVRSWFRSEKTVTSEDDYKIKRIRTAIAVFSLVTAACNAGTQVEVGWEFLDLNETYPKLELIAGAIASFSTAFWAIDEILLSRFHLSNPREILAQKIDKVIEFLPRMSDRILRQLKSMTDR